VDVGHEQDGYVRLLFLDGADEVDPRARILNPPAGEIDVRDDAERELPVFLKIGPCLLVRRTEEDLRPGPHPEELVGQVDPFGDEPLGLLQDFGVDNGEDGGIEPDAVLDHEDRLYPDHARVVVDVDPVFQGLDDRDDDPEIPLPDEHLVEDRRVAFKEKVLELPVVVREQHDRDVQPRFPDQPRELDRRHVVDMERGDHEVEPAFFFRQRYCFLPARDSRKLGGMAQVEPLVLVPNQLVESPVLFEEVQVIQARDEEHVADPEPHQVLKTLEPVPVPVLDEQCIEGLCDAVDMLIHGARSREEWYIRAAGTARRAVPAAVTHDNRRSHYTTPWSIIASATFRNPPMLAPLT
jgi:hypothetical protein